MRVPVKRMVTRVWVRSCPFKGFKISFVDMFTEKLMPDGGFEMTPIHEFTEISKDSDS